jgi:hypothetical protein
VRQILKPNSYANHLAHGGAGRMDSGSELLAGATFDAYRDCSVGGCAVVLTLGEKVRAALR